MKSEQWQFGEHILAPGEKKQVFIHPYGEEYYIPSTLINGSSPGKTIVISAGLHSGEYPGVAASIQAAAYLEAEKIKGRVLLLHAINTSGFFAHSEGVVAEDGVNLNACFPGSREGSIGQKVAAYLEDEIMPLADFIMDLHSGGGMEPLAPCLFFPNAVGEKVRSMSLAAAAAISTPHLIASEAISGFYSYAATKGIPGILVERGGCNNCHPDDVAKVQMDILLLLNHFGLVELKDKSALPEKTLWHKVDYVVSRHQGLWYPAVKPGDVVQRGGLIGRIQDFFGKNLGEYRASADSRIMYNYSGLAINNGTPIAACGIIDEAHILVL
ncbi:MAG: M14 family metallopeptidase [Bacillota bacterium]|nr:M14 family metallopeptidase [Bacillota bacterium]